MTMGHHWFFLNGRQEGEWRRKKTFFSNAQIALLFIFFSDFFFVVVDFFVRITTYFFCCCSCIACLTNPLEQCGKRGEWIGKEDFEKKNLKKRIGKTKKWEKREKKKEK